MSDKRKYSLARYLSDSEQKVLYYIIFLFACGLILKIYGYFPKPQTTETRLNLLAETLAEDYIAVYDLNTVQYDELLYISGIGPATANAILEYQQEKGFKSVDELINVKGIGEMRLASFREHFYVVGDSTVIVLSTTQPTTTNKININTATIEQLSTLRGIGPKRAADIIAYRTDTGGFHKIDDIKLVRGIGDKTFEQIKEFICIGE